MEKTTFAIVGTGIVGERIIKQILENDAAQIVALYDDNKERLTEIANTYNLQITSSFEALLALKPDWVYIGTPPVSHAELSERALANGLAVLCEKPLAHDVEDGKVMVKAAQNKDLKTAMHFPLMYSPPVREMMKLVENKAIGELVRVELNTYFPHWPRLWQQNPWIASRKQGGFTREVFPHYFQLMNRMFGSISISSHKTIYPDDFSLAETSVLAIGQTENDIPLLINGLSGIGQEEELSYIIYGTEGVLKLRNWSELSIASIDEPFKELNNFAFVKTLIDECIAAANGKDSLLVTFDEGMKVQQIIDQLLEHE